MRCKECDRLVDDGVLVCPYCGGYTKKFTDEEREAIVGKIDDFGPKPRDTRAKISFIISLIVFGLAILCLISNLLVGAFNAKSRSLAAFFYILLNFFYYGSILGGIGGIVLGFTAVRSREKSWFIMGIIFSFIGMICATVFLIIS